MTVAYGAIYDQLKFEESIEAAKRKANELATTGTGQQIADLAAKHAAEQITELFGGLSRDNPVAQATPPRILA